MRRRKRTCSGRNRPALRSGTGGSRFQVQLSLLLLSMIALGAGSGCSLLNTEPFVDTTRGPQGELLLADTPRMWRDWCEVVDSYVGEEVARGRPPGGSASWEVHWQRMIDVNRVGRENAVMYIAYIVEARREAELPELHLRSAN